MSKPVKIWAAWLFPFPTSCPRPLKVFKSGEREKFYKEVWTIPFMP